MNFCKECENMLYIKISDADENELSFYCRKCGNNEQNVNNLCVLKENFQEHSIKINHLINEYTKMDPTLPHINNIKCPNSECQSETNDVIYMRYDENNMKYLYICVHCDFVWKLK